MTPRSLLWPTLRSIERKDDRTEADAIATKQTQAKTNLIPGQRLQKGCVGSTCPSVGGSQAPPGDDRISAPDNNNLHNNNNNKATHNNTK